MYIPLSLLGLRLPFAITQAIVTFRIMTTKSIPRNILLSPEQDEWLRQTPNASETVRLLITTAMLEEQDGDRRDWGGSAPSGRSPLDILLEHPDAYAALVATFQDSIRDKLPIDHGGAASVSLSLPADQREWLEAWARQRVSKSRVVQLLIRMGMVMSPDPATPAAPAPGTAPKPDRREVDGYTTYGDPGHQQLATPTPPANAVPTAPPPIPSFKPGGH